MKPKLLIVGAAGRMGRLIMSLAIASDEFTIVGAVERQGHPDIGKDAGVLAGAKQINIAISDTYPVGAEAVIDFSQPQALSETIDYCIKNKAALVLGTTGLAAEQHEKVRKLAAKAPVICQTNMSVGMNVLFALVGKVAAMLGDEYDAEIIEQHHRFKKDAPSGSALTLAQNLCEATGKSFPDSLVYGRNGKEALRKKGTIGVHAVRAGDIAGIHSVIFSTLGETVTLNHTAHSRDTFAAGALRAAKWLIGKKPSLYSMADCLGIK